SLLWFSTCWSGSLFRFDCRNRLLALVCKYFTFKYPHLDTNNTVCSLCFCHTVIDICTQCMQWHTAFAIPLCTCNFDTIQAARAHDLDALSTQAHCILHCALHGAAEHH